MQEGRRVIWTDGNEIFVYVDPANIEWAGITVQFDIEDYEQEMTPVRARQLAAALIKAANEIEPPSLQDVTTLKMYGRLDAPTLMKRVQEAMEALFVRDDATLDQKVIATLWQHFLESGVTL